MNSFKSTLSALVLLSALGVAGALFLGAANALPLFAVVGVTALAVADYSRAPRSLVAARVKARPSEMSELRLAP